MFFIRISASQSSTTIDLRVRAGRLRPDAAAVVAMFRRGAVRGGWLACEIQAALRSPHFAVGPLAAAHERPITLFHEHLLAAMR
jgi:hypothetical protein